MYKLHVVYTGPQSSEGSGACYYVPRADKTYIIHLNIFQHIVPGFLTIVKYLEWTSFANRKGVVERRN